MADSSVPITAGSGTNISTRTNTAGEHIQDVQEPVAATTNHTNVVAAAADTQLLAAAAGERIFASVYNDSSSDVYVKWATGASATSFAIKLAAGGYVEVPKAMVKNAVHGFWVTATGNARVVEGVA